MSYVNGICTLKGGSHVTYIADQVVDHLLEKIKKKAKDIKFKPF